MDYEYEVTFVYPYTVISRIVWTPSQNEDEVIDIALREIAYETGLVIEGADCQVELTGTIGKE